jgi:hypothetical protein
VLLRIGLLPIYRISGVLAFLLRLTPFSLVLTGRQGARKAEPGSQTTAGVEPIRGSHRDDLPPFSADLSGQLVGWEMPVRRVVASELRCTARAAASPTAEEHQRSFLTGPSRSVLEVNGYDNQLRRR